MTTNNHSNNFIELDSEIHEELSKTADELLEVENLDLNNEEYLAKILFRLKRYDESIEHFKRILSLESDNETAIAFIGINHFRKEDYETAAEYFRRGLEMDSENFTLLSYMMLSCELMNDYKNAIIYGEKILKDNPKYACVINHLVDYHYELKNYDTCIAYMNQIKYKNISKKALILYESKRYDECIELANRTRNAEAYHFAGKAYLELNNITKAVKYIYKSCEKDFNTDTLFEISEICFEAKDYGRAIPFLKEVLDHDDSNIEACSRIATAHYNSANWHDAKEYAEKTLEISKKVPQAYITLAGVEFQLTGSVEKSLQIVEEGLRENPESWMLWAQKGGFAFEYNPIEFKESYRKALSLNSHDYKLHFEYLTLLLMIEDLDEAKKQYNRMILVNPLYEMSFEELKKQYTWNVY